MAINERTLTTKEWKEHLNLIIHELCLFQINSLLIDGLENNGLSPLSIKSVKY